MIEKIDKNNDEEKVLEELENMNLEERIKDQKDFLRMYFDSDGYNKALRNEISIYSMLKNGSTPNQVNMTIHDQELSQSEKELFDKIKNSKKESINNINIIIVKVEDSSFGGITVFQQNGSKLTTNMEGSENDPMVQKLNNMLLNGELKNYDVVINNTDKLAITSPIHEMYHSIDDRLYNMENNDIIGRYLANITDYFKNTAKINLKEFKPEWLEYIFKLEEIRSVIIEIKYIMYKLEIRDMKEEINGSHINKMINIFDNKKYPKIRSTISDLLNRIQTISGGRYNYEDMKKNSSIKSLEYIIQVEEGAKLLLKILMNDIGSNNSNNKIGKDQIYLG